MGRYDPNIEAVRALRESEGLGLLEGRKRLRRENMLRAVAEIRQDSASSADKIERVLDLVEDLILNPL